jgi:transposase
MPKRKAKKPRGRPSKAAPEVMGEFLKAIRAGNYIETAAAYAGLSKQSVYDWMKKGARKESPEFIGFLDAVKKAQAQNEARDIALISKAAEKQWQAAAWKLERMFPARWGQRIRVTVDQEQHAFLERLEKGLPPEVFERVLRIGTGTAGAGETSEDSGAEADAADEAASSADGVDSEGEPGADEPASPGSGS